MRAIPRSRPQTGPVLLSAGFRPFFLLAALWATLAVPLWLLVSVGHVNLPSKLPPQIWHTHEMVFGFGAAVVAGFLLTSIPNWTGRPSLQGGRLACLVAIWATGRLAILFSGQIGAIATAVFDLLFPLVFLAVAAREIIGAGNWRNLPVLGALALLMVANLLTHLDLLGLSETAPFGGRLGIATLLMLITLVGGRIIPTFTRNWLVRERPGEPEPASFGALDRFVLGLVGLTLGVWLCLDATAVASWVELAGGIAIAVRLARWRGEATFREPLIWILHLGYGWLAIGFFFLALSGFMPDLSKTTALHALTVGAIGTMTLAVMTRATLGHTGRPLTAGAGTTVIYGLITLATIARVLVSFGGDYSVGWLCLSGGAWSGAFGLFTALYARPLIMPRTHGGAAQAI